jgi:hypothetical protein
LTTAEFLIEARSRGARFDRAGTIGRQGLFVGPRRLLRLLTRHGTWPADRPTREFYELYRSAPGFLDPLLMALGAREVTSIDASPYEGADVIHNLNATLPPELRSRFSLLFDGGSLEHIFNVPVALRSYMEMVEVGGHLIILTVANNFFGHGFYQFSAELFYRVLSPENGYEVERVVVQENDFLWTNIFRTTLPVEVAGPSYDAADPAVVRSRVLLQSKNPVVIHVQARRIRDLPVLARAPEQSDYVAQWAAHAASDSRPLREHLANRVPVDLLLQAKWDILAPLCSALRPFLRHRERKRRSFRNRRWYRRAR